MWIQSSYINPKDHNLDRKQMLKAHWTFETPFDELVGKYGPKVNISDVS